MRARLNKTSVPDLFAPATAEPKQQVFAPKVSTDTVASASSSRHLLPKDLPAALVWLDDSELDSLLAAVIEEAKRRDRAPKTSVAPHARQARTDNNETKLPLGQMNAVRAAFKAGVKPSMIARQFGISQSDVRKAIASDVRQHNI
jgi:hypothetical protein